MKGLVIFISILLLFLLILEKSGALRTTSYTVVEGTIRVEKTKAEWHPEKVSLYLKALYRKWAARFFRKQTSSFYPVGRDFLSGFPAEGDHFFVG